MSSANAFNLGKCRIMLFRKELIQCCLLQDTKGNKTIVCGMLCVNPLRNNNTEVLSKLKAFVDINLNCAQSIVFVSDRLGNIMGKG